MDYRKIKTGLVCMAVMNSFAAEQVDNVKPAESAHPIRIVAFGASTTAKKSDKLVYLDYLERDLPQHGIEIVAINSGIGGNTSEAARKRFTKDVLDHHPDLVIIQLGTNDAAVDVWKTPPADKPRVSLEDFRSNLEYFIETLKKRECKVLLMTPQPLRWAPHLKKLYGKPPYDPNDPDGFNVVIRSYVDCVRKIAEERSVSLADVNMAFEEYGASEGQSIDDLFVDGMHPSAQGYELIADVMLKEILKMKIPSCKTISL